jgi:hypothetical protein
MLCTRLIIHFAAVVWVLSALQEVLHQVDRVIQIVIVGFANVDVKFAFELWPKLFPVALKNVAEVVMLPPVFRY